MGPAAYLTKPVDPTSLQRAIELAVANFTASTHPGDDEDTASLPATIAPLLLKVFV